MNNFSNVVSSHRTVPGRGRLTGNSERQPVRGLCYDYIVCLLLSARTLSRVPVTYGVLVYVINGRYQGAGTGYGDFRQA